MPEADITLTPPGLGDLVPDAGELVSSSEDSVFGQDPVEVFRPRGNPGPEEALANSVRSSFTTDSSGSIQLRRDTGANVSPYLASLHKQMGQEEQVRHAAQLAKDRAGLAGYVRDNPDKIEKLDPSWWNSIASAYDRVAGHGPLQALLVNEITGMEFSDDLSKILTREGWDALKKNAYFGTLGMESGAIRGLEAIAVSAGVDSFLNELGSIAWDPTRPSPAADRKKRLDFLDAALSSKSAIDANQFVENLQSPLAQAPYYAAQQLPSIGGSIALGGTLSVAGVPLLAAALTTGLGFGVIETGHMFHELERQHPNYDRRTSALYSVGTGTVVGLIETIPNMIGLGFAKRFLSTSFKQVSKHPFRRTVLEGLGAWAAQTTAEALEEWSQEYALIAGTLAREWGAGDRTWDSLETELFSQDSWDRAKESFVQTMLGVGVLGSGHLGLSVYGKNRFVKQARDFQDAVSGLAEGATESADLIKTFPEIYQQMMNAAAIDGNIEGIYVDTDALAEAFKDDPKGWRDLVARIPDMQQRTNEARAIGGRVRFDVGEYATHLAGSTVHPQLANNLAFSSSQQTVEQRKARVTPAARREAIDALEKLADSAILATGESASAADVARLESEFARFVMDTTPYSEKASNNIAKVMIANRVAIARSAGLEVDELMSRTYDKLTIETLKFNQDRADQTETDAEILDQPFVLAAAIRTSDGEVFRGYNHGEAFLNAEAHLAEVGGSIEEGFVVTDEDGSNERFADREATNQMVGEAESFSISAAQRAADATADERQQLGSNPRDATDEAYYDTVGTAFTRLSAKLFDQVDEEREDEEIARDLFGQPANKKGKKKKSKKPKVHEQRVPGVDELDAPVLPEGRVEAEALAASRRADKAGTNLTSTRLSKIFGAPKPRKGSKLDSDVKPTSWETLNTYVEWAIERASGMKDWYKEFGQGFIDLVGEANLQEASLVFGITSAQNASRQNFKDTLRIMIIARQHSPITDPKGFRAAIRNRPKGKGLKVPNKAIDTIIKAYETGTYETTTDSGLKVSIYQRLVRDLVLGLFNPYGVMDVHMSRVFGWLRKGVDKDTGGIVDQAQFPTAASIRYGMWMTAKLAKAHNVSIHQMQAMLWFYAKSNLSPRGKIVTRQSNLEKLMVKEGRAHPKPTEGSFEEAFAFTDTERAEIEQMAGGGAFDKTKPLTAALGEGKTPAFRSSVKSDPYTSVELDSQLERLSIARENLGVLASTNAGRDRGYAWSLETSLEDLVAYHRDVLNAITDEGGKVRILTKLGIPHDVHTELFGTWDRLEPSIRVTLRDATMATAEQVANLLGDALLQDAAIAERPNPDADHNSVVIYKPDGTAFSIEEVADAYERLNPGESAGGLNLTTTNDRTGLRLIDSTMFEQENYDESDFDSFVLKVAGAIGGGGFRLVAHATESSYVGLTETGPGDRGQVWDRAGLAGRPDLQAAAVRDLYEPIWRVYSAHTRNLEQRPQQARSPLGQFKQERQLGTEGRAARARSDEPASRQASKDLGRLGLLDGSGLVSLEGDAGNRLGLGSLHEGSKLTPETERAVIRAMGGTLEPGTDTNERQKIYRLTEAFGDTVDQVIAKLKPWLDRVGFQYELFGPHTRNGKAFYPDFRSTETPTYEDGVVWLFDPSEGAGGFRDEAYTLAWRVTHEVAHALVNERMSARYGGRGRRGGAMGVIVKGPFYRGDEALSLADALRAVEWERETFVEQRRILSEEFGVEITDDEFASENAINLIGAVSRALTGQFSDPGDLGYIPTPINPDLLWSKAQTLLRGASLEINRDVSSVLGESVTLEQPAIHATAAEFDPETLRVDMSGTGLGLNQGWGIYFQKAVDVARWYRLLAGAGDQPGTGQILRAEIPEDSELADWNLPLDQQPEGVKPKLRAAIVKLSTHPNMLAGLKGRVDDGQGELLKMMLSLDGKLSREDYEPPKFKVLYDRYFTNVLKSASGASMAFRDVGIDGHRFNNASEHARSEDRDVREGEDAPGYVIWNDEAIQAIERLEQPDRGGQAGQAQAEQPRAHIEIARDRLGRVTNFFLRLNEGKLDDTSLIHELAHMTLEDIFDLDETQTDPDLEVHQIAQTIRGWLGITHRSEMTRELHEKFAETYEFYLSRGEAPSSELRDAFAWFRERMLAIYGNIRARLVYADHDLQIKSVFDKLHATSQQIDIVRAQNDAVAVFASTSLEGATDRERQDVTLALRRVYAEERKRVAAVKARALDREQKALQGEIREEVTSRIMGEKVNRAWYWLQHGEFPDKTTLEGLEHGKLDATSVREMVRSTDNQTHWGPLKMSDIPRPVLARRPGIGQDATSAGAVSPDSVAPALGYRDGLELLRALAGMDNPRDRVGDEVHRIAMERGLLDTPVELRAQTLSALESGDLRNELYEVELAVARRLSRDDQARSGARASESRAAQGEPAPAPSERSRAVNEAAQALQDAADRGDSQELLEGLQERLLLAREAAGVGKERAADQRAARGVQASTRKLPLALLRQHAESIVDKVRAIELPSRVRAWEQARAGASRQKLTDAGERDWGALARSIEREQLAATLASIGRKRLEEATKHRAKVVSYRGPNTRAKRMGKYDESRPIIGAILALVASVDPRRISKKKLDSVERQISSAEDVVTAARVEAERLGEHGIFVALPAWVKLKPDPSQGVFPEPIPNWGQLTVAELSDLYTAIVGFEKAGMAIVAIKEGNTAAEVVAANNAMLGQLTKHATRLTLEFGRVFASHKTAKKEGKLSRLIANSISPETIVELLDRGPTGPFHDHFLNPLLQGRRWRINKMKELHGTLNALRKEHYSDLEWARLQTDAIRIDSLNDGEGGYVTRNVALGVAANLGNEHNRAALRDAKKLALTDPQIIEITGHLTQNDIDYMLGVVGAIDSLWPDAAKLEERTNGVVPAKVTGDPWVLPASDQHEEQVVRGFYFPLRFDPDTSARSLQFSEQEKLQASRPQAHAQSMTKAGSLYERKQTSGGLTVLPDFVATTLTHLDRVATDIAYREPLANADRVLRDLHGPLREVLGAEVAGQFKGWLNRIASNQRETTETAAVASFLARTRHGVSLVAMGIKLTTAVIQWTGSFASIPQVGAGWVARGYLGLVSNGNPYKNFLELRELIPELADRMNNFEREAAQKILQVKPKWFASMRNAASAAARSLHGEGSIGYQEFAKNLGNADAAVMSNMMGSGFMLIGMIDQVTAGAVAHGAYLKAMNGAVDGVKVGDSAGAVAYAESVIRQTQGTGDAFSLPAIMDSTEFMKLLTTFMTFQNAMMQQAWKLNRLATDEEGGRQYLTLKGESGRLYAHVALVYVIEPVIGLAIRELIKSADPDRPEEFEDRFTTSHALWEIVSAWFGGVLGARQLVSALQYGRTGSTTYDRFFESIIKVKNVGEDYAEGHGDSLEAFTALADTTAFLGWGLLPSRALHFLKIFSKGRYGGRKR